MRTVLAVSALVGLTYAAASIGEPEPLGNRVVDAIIDSLLEIGKYQKILAEAYSDTTMN